ncbi:N-acetylmuramoyl-L-alanine amidase [Sphingomonas sp. GB1N7]|uniref:N-acetylmuramoyl-L-alanine amidase n=1 Tax=Parasphingomonas caseinilytica TaxID=3096158 RepID=UPI002FC64FBF
MGVIVIDPGHGGTANIPNDSTYNNATSASGVPEKAMTLDICKRIRWALQSGSGQARAAALGKTVSVVLTRETDVNLSLGDRAAVAADNDADLFLSLHFNGFNGKTRGTEAYIDRKYMQAVQIVSAGSVSTAEGPGIPSSGLRNINVAQDAAFASAIVQAAYGTLKALDPKAVLRSANYTKPGNGESYTPPPGVKMKGLGVLRDTKLGTRGNDCRATLVELEFIDVPAVDALLNGAGANDARNRIASAIAVALVEAL